MAATVAHTIAGIAPGHRPTAAEVRAFEAPIYAAACSMPSHRGGGILGHVGSVMPAAQYLAIARCYAGPYSSWLNKTPERGAKMGSNLQWMDLQRCGICVLCALYKVRHG